MKHGSGIKGLDDKSSGMEILIADAFAKINPTRRVSDEVFEERFLGICHNTEDFVTAAKSTGLGNTRKLSKWKVFEVLNERDFVFSIQHVKLEMTRR